MSAHVLSPELTRNAITLARHLAAGARAWTLYPPEHPAVREGVVRLTATLREVTGGAPFSFGVAPRTLVVAGVPLPEESQPVADAAALLHDHDILQITFVGEAPTAALEALFALLGTDAAALRARGGPADAWQTDGHPAIVIDQVDYAKILEDREGAAPPERRDDVWTSLVTSLTRGASELDALQQQRLLEISASAFEIGELATAVAAPQCTPDGSPLITTQAATVLATFRHLAGLVGVIEPDRLPEVFRHLATASGGLDPHVVVAMMQTDEGPQEAPLLGPIAAAFDDATVAELLAGALSRDGRANARLAQVFDTIAPDADRKRRVLTMTRRLLDERDFGRSGQLKAAWASMEELLLKYDETPFVDEAYQATLAGVGGRAEAMAAREMPPELDAWKASLGQDNVRALSVMLLTDLLRMEDQAERAAGIADDMVALVEDLFAAGDFANAAAVLEALAEGAQGTLARAACRTALVSAAELPALRDAATLLDELDDDSADRFMTCAALMGPPSIRALFPILRAETPSPAWPRARALVERFGRDAAEPLLPLADDAAWHVQRNAAELLGLTGSAVAVPALQVLLRRGDPRVTGPAVRALAGIDDPSASRALATTLRAAQGPARLAVVEALVAARDPRVVPMLTGLLAAHDPFGADHDTVLAALDALRQVPDVRAVPEVRAQMAKRRLFRRRKALALKRACIAVLEAIDADEARQALADARRSGDRLVRRLLRERAA